MRLSRASVARAYGARLRRFCLENVWFCVRLYYSLAGIINQCGSAEVYCFSTATFQEIPALVRSVRPRLCMELAHTCCLLSDFTFPRSQTTTNTLVLIKQTHKGPHVSYLFISLRAPAPQIQRGTAQTLSGLPPLRPLARRCRSNGTRIWSRGSVLCGIAIP